MVKKEISKTEAKKKIEEFFSEINQKSPEELRKIKKISTSNRISLKEYKSLFCKKCLKPHSSLKIRIKNKIKIVECKDCGYKTRKKLK